MAVPTFSDYLYKSRTTEATEFLGVIRLREEAYRAEFGAYCPTLVDVDTTDPDQLDTPSNLLPDPSTTGRETAAFVPTVPWRQLGATPSGQVRFGYGVVAGPPAAAPAGYNFESRPDFWWLARAVADLDEDGTYVMFETYSSDKGIFIGRYGTDETIDKGWE